MIYGLTKGCLLSYTIIWCIEGFEKDLCFCFWGICCCCCFFYFLFLHWAKVLNVLSVHQNVFTLWISRFAVGVTDFHLTLDLKWLYITILNFGCDQLQRLWPLLNITNTSGLVEFRSEPLDCFRFIIGSALIYRSVEK